VQPEDVFDSVHLAAAEQVAAFEAALKGVAKSPPEEVHLHADHAYLFVEFLANTYPKLPRDASERDLWVFLFDYAIAEGPFAGGGMRVLPRSVALFFEFLARGQRVHELPHIRTACAMEAYYLGRLEGYLAIASLERKGGEASERAARALEDWWADLDLKMRARGLAPDAALAGGEETWSLEMGPVEAAVFDALCVVLAKRAREFRSRRAPDEQVERELLALQRRFMEAHNPGLGRAPLEAIREERAALGARRD
jgi:hypothetical protein